MKVVVVAAPGRRFVSLVVVALVAAAGLTMSVTGPASTALASTTTVTDEFNGPTLDPSWTVVDPNGKASVSVSAGELHLGLPAGAPNDAWPDNRSVRVVQNVSDSDFTAEVGFTTVPSARYQDQGLLLEQDADNWLRFDVFNDGSRLRAFVGLTAGGVNSVVANSSIRAPGSALGLRVVRTGQDLALQWSGDGGPWNSLVSVTHSMAVARLGVYAGNNKPTASGTAPAWTADVDYVRTSSAVPPPTTSTSVPATTTTTTTTTTMTTTTTTTSASSTTATVSPSPTTSPSPGTTLPVSDDFSSGSLNPRWSVVDPVGDGSVELTGQGTSDARVALGVPAGSDHNVWQDSRGLLLVQPASDVDLGVTAKFDSVPSRKYQMQGVIVRASASEWLRFGVYSDGSGLVAFAASTVNDVSTARLSRRVTATATVRIRVARSGSTWRFDVAPDTGAFITVGSFGQALVVRDIGVYSGNHATSGSPPAYLALVDYFFNTASPISPEDGSASDPTPPPVDLRAIKVTAASTAARVEWATDSATTATVRYGTTTQYGSTAAVTDAATVHSVVLRGLAPGTTYHFQVVATTSGGEQATSPDKTFVATFSSGPGIDVWYGSHQTFGSRGTPQKWVNVLGTVFDPDGVASLSYTVDGGGSRSLSMGPNNRRLQDAGDFNADIPWSSLAVGDHTVTLSAKDGLGNLFSRQITVTLVGATAPGLPFTLTWDPTKPVSQQAQVADGLWRTTARGAEPVRTGYDRLIVVGDQSWTDYDATVPITIDGFGPYASGIYTPPLVGLALHWRGHDASTGKGQPVWGVYPTGAFAWYRWYSTPKIEMRGNNDTPTVTKPKDLVLGSSYLFKARARMLSGEQHYFFKMWRAGSQEPTSWDAEFTATSGPTSGAVAIYLHHVYGAIGNITVARP